MIKNIFILFIIDFWNLLKEVSPWILLGFFFSGILKVYLSRDRIHYYIGKSNLYSIIKASFLGIPLPLCSCGVIPVAISLNKYGASKGSVASFLISTPQTGIDNIFSTYGLLGFTFALIRALIGLFSGIFGGIIINLFFKSNIKNKFNIKQDKNITINNNKKKILYIFYYGFVEMTKNLGKWIFLGLIFASIFSICISENFLLNKIDSIWKEFMMMGIISIPLYVCATGSIPIAFIFLTKGISPGGVLLFLILGPATNITSIIMLINSLGKKFTIIYLISLIIISVFFSILINTSILKNLFSIKANAIAFNHSNNIFNNISALILLALLLYQLFLYFYTKNYTNNLKSKSFFISGISCNCSRINLEQKLLKLKGIKTVKIDLNTNKIIIFGDFNKVEFQNYIIKLGFKLKN